MYSSPELAVRTLAESIRRSRMQTKNNKPAIFADVVASPQIVRIALI
jgi:hypothetical protein